MGEGHSEMLDGNQFFSPHLGGRDERSTSIHMQQWEMQEKGFAAKSWTGGSLQVSTNHMKTEEGPVYSKGIVLVFCLQIWLPRSKGLHWPVGEDIQRRYFEKVQVKNQAKGWERIENPGIQL